MSTFEQTQSPVPAEDDHGSYDWQHLLRLAMGDLVDESGNPYPEPATTDLTEQVASDEEDAA